MRDSFRLHQSYLQISITLRNTLCDRAVKEGVKLAKTISLDSANRGTTILVRRASPKFKGSAVTHGIILMCSCSLVSTARNALS